MKLPFTKLWKTAGRGGFQRVAEECGFMLHFRCLSDIQVKVSSRQVNLRVWNLRRSLGLVYKFGNLQPRNGSKLLSLNVITRHEREYKQRRKESWKSPGRQGATSNTHRVGAAREAGGKGERSRSQGRGVYQGAGGDQLCPMPLAAGAGRGLRADHWACLCGNNW